MIAKVIKLTCLGHTLKPCRNLFTSESYARLSSGGWRGIDFLFIFFFMALLCAPFMFVSISQAMD